MTAPSPSRITKSKPAGRKKSDPDSDSGTLSRSTSRKQTRANNRKGASKAFQGAVADILEGEEAETPEVTRDNILLFLQNLSSAATNDAPTGANFQTALTAAVGEALAPANVAAIDLSVTGGTRSLFANTAGATLTNTLLGLIVTGGAARVVAEEAKRKQIERTLGYLQAIIPLDSQKPEALAEELDELNGAEKDAGWIYGVMWTACLQWMDMRLRQMQGHGFASGNAQPEPVGLQWRMKLINARVHGGNLRVDAVMSHIKYGEYRHSDPNYDVYFRGAFQKMYGLTIEDGFWLAQHGDEVVYKVDWPLIIGHIDKYISVRDRVLTMFPNGRVTNLDVVHTKLYLPLIAFVSGTLIASAQKDEAWVATAADLRQLKTLMDAVVRECQKWKMNGKDRQGVWDELKTQTWKPADYLREIPTAGARVVRKPGEAAAVMKLRPRARIEYSGM